MRPPREYAEFEERYAALAAEINFLVDLCAAMVPGEVWSFWAQRDYWEPYYMGIKLWRIFQKHAEEFAAKTGRAVEDVTAHPAAKCAVFSHYFTYRCYDEKTGYFKPIKIKIPSAVKELSPEEREVLGCSAALI